MRQFALGFGLGRKILRRCWQKGDNGEYGLEGFVQTELKQLRQRREGMFRRALGVALGDETTEQLDRKGELDRTRAERGLVSIMDQDGTIAHKHLEDPTTLDGRTNCVRMPSLTWRSSTPSSP